MDLEVNPMPIVCDMSTAPDTGPQRLAEYDRLFSTHLLGRERRGEGVRFRLQADPGVEAWVRDLAALEKACCAFLDSHIAVEGGQVLWDITTIDDDIARAILNEYYDLPDSAGADADELERRLSVKGLQFIGTPGSTGAGHPSSPAECVRSASRDVE
jgi:hypothetical protein